MGVQILLSCLPLYWCCSCVPAERPRMCWTTHYGRGCPLTEVVLSNHRYWHFLQAYWLHDTLLPLANCSEWLNCMIWFHRWLCKYCILHPVGRKAAGLLVLAAVIRARESHMEGAGNCACLTSNWTCQGGKYGQEIEDAQETVKHC